MSFLGVTPDAVDVGGRASGFGGFGAERGQCGGGGPHDRGGRHGGDEVSAAVQSLFAVHAQAYQSVGARIAAFHSQFVSLLNGGAASYLSTEIANAQQTLGGGAPASAVPAVVVGGGGGSAPPPSSPQSHHSWAPSSWSCCGDGN